MKKTILSVLIIVASITAFNQQRTREEDSIARRKYQDSIRTLTKQDHKEMLALLNIKTLRPGANGSNPNAPNAANYEESKANPFPVLPAALVLKNGKKVATANDWWQRRRPEIIEDGWVDVRGMFMAAVAAGPVYKLLGKKELGTDFEPGSVQVAQSGNNLAGKSDKGLKDYYSNYFPIGVAVSPRALKTDEAALIISQFNSMTPENAMKMGPIHPRENEYFWKDADSIAAFAKQNNLKLRGHTLCWHSQAPPWFFIDSVTGKPVSKEVLLKRLKDHITTVVSRYKGTIYAWDVVNEAISDKPDEYLRNTEFYKIIGDEYIARAFQYAHEADPAALLFYNDYNEINPIKREKIHRLVKSLLDAGIPIHGVGLQGHWAINEPTVSQLDSTFSRFADLGLKLQITELDISIHPKEHNARERRSVDTDTSFSPAKEKLQMDQYKICFEVFRKYKKVISGVTFWNISDRRSWLDNFPVRGRKDYPLLFDKELKPKKAYWEVVNF